MFRTILISIAKIKYDPIKNIGNKEFLIGEVIINTLVVVENAITKIYENIS